MKQTNKSISNGAHLKNAGWWEGYNAGYKAGTAQAVRYFEQLVRDMEVPGVGPKTTEKIVQAINEKLEAKHP